MAKLFKKSIACLIAVLMVISSMPFTALTAMAAEESYTFSAATKTGNIDSNGGRIDTSAQTFNIVNDRQDANFSIGFWQYDLTDLRSKNPSVLSASMSVSVTADALADCQGLTFYYVGNTLADSLASGNNRVSEIMGEATKHQAKAIERYALTAITSFPKSVLVNGATLPLNLKGALNAAISKGLNNLTIMVMQSSMGGNNGDNDWTDTTISYANNSITCTIDAQEVIENAGLSSLKQAIAQYEAKMERIGSDNVLYTNMAPAYQAYLKAIRYRDAYEFGTALKEKEYELDTVKNELTAATAAMGLWTDTVTGNYASKIPSFNNQNVSSSDFYSNIIYTGSCSSGRNGNSDGSDVSGRAVAFEEKASTLVEVYYADTILLYDGAKPAVLPVMFGAKRKTNSARYIYTVYPAATNAAGTYESTFAGNDPNLYGLSYVKSDQEYDFRGTDGDGCNVLDFNKCRTASSYVGCFSGNPNARWSKNLGFAWGKGYWNHYATGFQVNDEVDFKGKGVIQVGTKWAWYGGSTANATDAKNIDANLKGYADSSKKIYVVNYKGLMTAVKNVQKQARLNNVSQYTEGGLSSIMAAYDAATSFDVNSITIDNVASKGTEIENAIEGINDTPTADTDADGYQALKNAVNKARKTYTNGNANNENYTAESWAPFEMACRTSINYFNGLLTENISTLFAQSIADDITNTQAALVLNREVVDSRILEHAIDNAEAIISNPQYFVSTSIDVATLSSLVSAAKVAVWGSEDNYGVDAEKILKTAANETIVSNHITALVAEINRAQIDITTIVPTYSYNLNTAIAAAAEYESTRDNYSNYASLETAVNNAVNFRDNVPVINGRIEDQVINTINTYVSYVDAIGYAIATLRPSFTLVQNGTVANPGTTITTSIVSASRPNNFWFKWNHTTDIVYFKTERDAATYVLPVSNWESYDAQKGTEGIGYDTLLDSINLNAQDVQSGELTNAYNTWNTSHKGSGMGAADIETYQGMLSINNNNLGLRLSNFKVSKASSKKGLGVDRSGSFISDANYDFTDVLSTTEGSEDRIGGILAFNGSTYFNCDATISVPATTGAANASNTPSVKSKLMDLGGAGTEIGIVYFWRYAETKVNNWSGYSFDKAPLNLKVGVVDLCTLFDLIASCEDPEFTATANNYTTASWNALLKAIQNAKADMEYGSMTYNEIISECDNRYNALLEAKNKLVAPASNAKLKAALQATKNAYENDESKVDPATWPAFESAYENALSKFQGNYSDTGIRDYGKELQATVDAVADALTDAFNALAYKIDFTVVDDAVAALIASIDTERYTATSLQALISAIDSLTYFNWDATERNKHFSSDTALQTAVTNEARQVIPGLISVLVEGTADDTVLAEAKANGKAKLADPDAYDQDEINAALSQLNEFVDVNVKGTTIKGFAFDTQAEVDEAVANYLEGINIIKYDVYRDGVKLGAYEYGQQINVASADESKVDWYYESQSNTAYTANKYLTTAEGITFVVKGETNLTTKKSADPTSQVKITYVNGMNGKTFDVQYVDAGATVTFDASKAPKVACHSFEGYTVNGSTASSVKADADVFVVATYSYTANFDYTVYVADLGYGYGAADFKIENLHYNDEIALLRGDSADEGYNGENVNYTITDGQDASNVTEVTVEGSGRYIPDMGNPEVYAWVEVDSTDKATLDTWFDAAMNEEVVTGMDESSRAFGTAAATTHGKVVAYGSDYTFRVHRNIALLALDKYTYDLAVAAGIIEDAGDDNGARVSTQSDLVIVEGTKFSIISTFTLPEDCKMVETGILFVADKNSSVNPDVPMTLSTVGTNGVARIKSTAHTPGDQYVISIKSTALAGKKVGQVGMTWVAYTIYTDKDGNTVTIYTEPTSPTNPGASF